MAFDPVTLLTMSVAVLVALGALMLHLSRGARGGARSCSLLRWSGAAFLCLGAGFAMILLAPTDVHAVVRVLGNGALMLPYGLLWGAARRFERRSAPFEAVSAGALAWLLAAALLDPPQGARIALTSAIVAAYSFAIAREHSRAYSRARDRAHSDGGDGLQAQRHASWVFAAHGAFFALRAVLGPTFGFGTFGPDVAQLWGALLGIETVTMAVAVAVASVGMSRERAVRQHRREALEDPLTGVGNLRALHRSGEGLIGACRRDGRPASLLLMDLDGFKLVNDRHGHPAGDRLLVAFARLAHDYLPPTALVCRVGGEEFAALLPGADLARARAVADELRALFAHVVLDTAAGALRTTVSIGVAGIAEGATGVGEVEGGAEGVLQGLLGRADLCLYAAKGGGRDRVVVEGDAAAPAPAKGRRTAA